MTEQCFDYAQCTDAIHTFVRSNMCRLSKAEREKDKTIRKYKKGALLLPFYKFAHSAARAQKMDYGKTFVLKYISNEVKEGTGMLQNRAYSHDTWMVCSSKERQNYVVINSKKIIIATLQIFYI